MDYSAEQTRRSGSAKSLDGFLREVRNLQRQDSLDKAYDLLDRIYMHFGEAALEPIQDIAPEFYADVTETIEFQGGEQDHQLVRREAQALEAIAQQTTRRPRIYEVSETGQVYILTAGRGLESIPQEFYQLPQLRKLELSYNKLSSLQGLPNCRELEQLFVYNNQLTTLQGMPNLPQLKFLTLRNNALLDLRNNELTSLQGMRNRSHLKKLGLSNNQLTSLKGMPNLPQLRYLFLDANQLTSLEGLPNLPQLQDLYLNRNLELQDPKRIQELRDRGVTVQK